MALVPWGFRCRTPAVLRTRSWRHWVVLFLSIDEGWRAWPPLTVTCTVLSWWGHVLSMTRDALKSSWNWTGSVRSNVALGSRLIGLGADATICFTLADDPALSYFWRAWHGRKPPSVNLPNSAPERLIMSASLFKPAIRRSEISLPGDVTLMSPWRWNLSRCRLHTMTTVVPLTSERLPTTCTIHPNLLDDDDVAHSAHVSLGTQKTVFCCSIVSAILASWTLLMIDSTFWMSGGSDHLTLHVYHVCVSVHTLEQRREGNWVQRVWLVLDTTWPWTRRTRHPRASWSICNH